jgi:hypothetical protein
MYGVQYCIATEPYGLTGDGCGGCQTERSYILDQLRGPALKSSCRVILLSNCSLSLFLSIQAFVPERTKFSVTVKNPTANEKIAHAAIWRLTKSKRQQEGRLNNLIFYSFPAFARRETLKDTACAGTYVP